MSDLPKSRSRGGCFTKFILLILWIGGAALASAVYFACQPQDLSDIGGYSSAPKPVPREDLRTVLKQSVERGHALDLTEKRLNDWLGQTVVPKQGGFFADKVTLGRVWVRLEDGFAEIILVREFMGHPFTVSLFLRISQLEGPHGLLTELSMDGGPYHKDYPQPPRGGRFGQLVVPQGFLILVMPAYNKLAELFPEEKNLGLEEMARIKIEKGHLILDPRAPEPRGGLGTQTF